MSGWCSSTPCALAVTACCTSMAPPPTRAPSRCRDLFPLIAGQVQIEETWRGHGAAQSFSSLENSVPLRVRRIPSAWHKKFRTDAIFVASVRNFCCVRAEIWPRRHGGVPLPVPCPLPLTPRLLLPACCLRCTAGCSAGPVGRCLGASGLAVRAGGAGTPRGA